MTDRRYQKIEGSGVCLLSQDLGVWRIRGSKYRIRQTTASLGSMRLSFKEKKGFQMHREEINNACILDEKFISVKNQCKGEKRLPCVLK